MKEFSQCPRHGSCFDLRSGKVMHGPAELEIKTYDVSVQNGKVLVRLSEEKPDKSAHAQSVA